MFELVIWPQEVALVRWTQPSGPLCLWQCFLHKGWGKHISYEFLFFVVVHFWMVVNDFSNICLAPTKRKFLHCWWKYTYMACWGHSEPGMDRGNAWNHGTVSKRVLILRTWSLLRTFLAFWVLFFISGSLFSLFWFYSRKECMYSTMVPCYTVGKFWFLRMLTRA